MKGRIQAWASKARQKARTTAGGLLSFTSRWKQNLVQRILSPEGAWNFRKLEQFVPLIERLQKKIERQGFGFYGTAASILISAFFLADLTALLVEGWIPSAPPTLSRSAAPSTLRRKVLAEYDVIFTRNLFNSAGLIPGEDNGSNVVLGSTGPATKTSLSVNLIGTLILEEEALSIATLTDRSDSKIYPVRIDDEIPNLLRVTRVEPRKVTFVNLRSGRLEYTDLPDEFAGKPMFSNSAPTGGKTVEQVSNTRFAISRNTIEGKLADLNKILTEARAVPNMENGVASGYRLFQIVPGSIYQELGLRDNDVILGVDGEPISDPGKAFEMLGMLKTRSNLELNIKRDGKEMNLTYDIQ